MPRDSAVVVTDDQQIYVWGDSLGYGFPLGEAIPQHIFDGGLSEETIDELVCASDLGDLCLFTSVDSSSSVQRLYGMGQNPWSNFGFAVPNVFNVPHLLRVSDGSSDVLAHFDVSYRNTYLHSVDLVRGNGTIESVGANANYVVARGSCSQLDAVDEFGPINETHLLPLFGAPPHFDEREFLFGLDSVSLLRVFRGNGYVVLVDGRIFAVGLARGTFGSNGILCSFKEVTEDGFYGLPADGRIAVGSEITDIQCLDACAAVAVNASGFGWVYTWGHSQEIKMVRDASIPTRFDPIAIRVGQIDTSGEHLVAVSMAEHGGFVLSDIGQLYAWGDNTDLRMLVENQAGLVLVTEPTRVLRDLSHVSYLPPRFLETSYVFGHLDITCDGRTPSDPLVCSGDHGKCVEMDECDCEDEWDGDLCERLRQCNGILATETALICSGHGVCVQGETCDCDSLHVGANCEFEWCFGLWGDEELVCNGFGTCVFLDVCLCEGNYCGKMCGELVEDAFLFGPTSEGEDDSRIEVEWITPNLLLGSLRGVDFDCSTVVASSFLAGVDATCRFELSSWITERLVIHLPSSSGPVQVGDELLLMPVTLPTQVISRTILAPPSSLSWTVLGPTVAVLTIVLLAAVLVVLVVLFALLKIVRQKTKLKKFEELENVDLILEEQRIERDSSRPHLSFSKNLFEIPPEELRLLKVIGRGGSGATVFLALWKQQVTCAFKSFKIALLQDTDSFDEFEKEVSVLGSVSHPHILQFYGACLSPPRVGICCEYCSAGDLISYLLQNEEPLSTRVRFLKEICTAMSFLHCRDIIHRDLKCENVLLTESLVTRLMDFGSARMNLRMSQVLTLRVGTAGHVAPEVTMGLAYGKPCDLYSFGIVIFCVVLNRFRPYPYETSGSVDVRAATDPEFRPVIPDEDEFPSDLARICRMCWHADPKKRPASFEVVLGMLEEVVTEDQSGGEHSLSLKSLTLLDPSSDQSPSVVMTVPPKKESEGARIDNSTTGSSDSEELDDEEEEGE